MSKTKNCNFCGYVKYLEKELEDLVDVLRCNLTSIKKTFNEEESFYDYIDSEFMDSFYLNLTRTAQGLDALHTLAFFTQDKRSKN